MRAVLVPQASVLYACRAGGWLTVPCPAVKDVIVILTFPKEVKSVDVTATIGQVSFPVEQQGKFVVRHCTRSDPLCASA